MTFTADHHGFYRNGAPFFSTIGQEAQIILPAALNQDLNWEKEISQALQLKERGQCIFWEIDLGLSSLIFLPEDQTSFFSFSIALEQFTKKLWPIFSEHTLGVGLYRGVFNPEHNFPRAYWEGEKDYALFCADALANYLHRLVSFLPEEVIPFALFDVSEINSSARIAQLFSKERFEYVHLGFRGSNMPISRIYWEEDLINIREPDATKIGVCLPKDDFLSEEIKKEIDDLLQRLTHDKKPFRIVPEEFLTEQWDGLDELIVFSDAVSAQGKRKLLGFSAAGGLIAQV